eukprot:9187537-Alexandrium_andersonii.AAC.1
MGEGIDEMRGESITFPLSCTDSRGIITRRFEQGVIYQLSQLGSVRCRTSPVKLEAGKAEDIEHGIRRIVITFHEAYMAGGMKPFFDQQFRDGIVHTDVIGKK